MLLTLKTNNEQHEATKRGPREGDIKDFKREHCGIDFSAHEM